MNANTLKDWFVAIARATAKFNTIEKTPHRNIPDYGFLSSRTPAVFVSNGTAKCVGLSNRSHYETEIYLSIVAECYQDRRGEGLDSILSELTRVLNNAINAGVEGSEIIFKINILNENKQGIQIEQTGNAFEFQTMVCKVWYEND